MNELGNACSGFDAHEIDELRAIAKTYREASGLVIKLSNFVGGKFEGVLKKVPDGFHKAIDRASDLALRTSYFAASTTHADDASDSYLNRTLARFEGERWHKIASAVTGAVGGFGGLGVAMAELATTTTVIMRSIQQIAETYGEDIHSEEVRLQCLGVFAFGGPLTEDDAVETGLYELRLALRGGTLEKVISMVLPRFGIVASEKLLAQAVPLIGAAAGAAINPIFTSYYQQMAHVQFRLRKLEQLHDAEQVRACFERITRVQRSK